MRLRKRCKFVMNVIRQKLTGQTAVLESTGKTFNEMEDNTEK